MASGFRHRDSSEISKWKRKVHKENWVYKHKENVTITSECLELAKPALVEKKNKKIGKGGSGPIKFSRKWKETGSRLGLLIGKIKDSFQPIIQNINNNEPK